MSDATEFHELQKDSSENKAVEENPENYGLCQVSTGTSPRITESESLSPSILEESKSGELESTPTPSRQLTGLAISVPQHILEEKPVSRTLEEEIPCDEGQSAKYKVQKVLEKYDLCSIKLHNLLDSLINNMIKLLKNIEIQKLPEGNLFGCKKDTVLITLLALNEAIRQEEGQAVTTIWYYWMRDFVERGEKSFNERAFREFFGLPGMRRFYSEALKLVLESLSPRKVFERLKASEKCCDNKSCGEECKRKLAEVLNVWENLIFIAIEPMRSIPTQLATLDLEGVKQDIIRLKAKVSLSPQKPVKRRRRLVGQRIAKKRCSSPGLTRPKELTTPSTGVDSDLLKCTSEQQIQCPSCSLLPLSPSEPICELLSQFLSAYYDTQNATHGIDSLCSNHDNAKLRKFLKRAETQHSLVKDAREIADVFGDFFKKMPPRVIDTSFRYCYEGRLFEQLLRSEDVRKVEALRKLKQFYVWWEEAESVLATYLDKFL